MEILAGTSGFSYEEWKGAFYPETLAKRGRRRVRPARRTEEREAG